MASCMTGMTDINHCARLIYWDNILLTFCLDWPQTVILLLSASQVAGITGVSHCACLILCLFWHLKKDILCYFDSTLLWSFFSSGFSCNKSLCFFHSLFWGIGGLSFFSFFFFWLQFFFFPRNGVWTQGFMFARQALYHLSHYASLKALGFELRASCLIDILVISSFFWQYLPFTY
jgi:hypothetical protein